MKFKEGDLVKIVKTYPENWSKNMNEWLIRLGTVSSYMHTTEDGIVYYYLIPFEWKPKHRHWWWFAEECLELATDEDIMLERL